MSGTDSPAELSDAFSPQHPSQVRAHRKYQALLRITERHARGESRERWEQYRMPMAPLDAWRRVVVLAGGADLPQDGEPPVDADDIAAALTLVHLARAEVDELEIGLIEMARGRGLTWQQIAFNLGLGSAQAARQRHQRLSGRSGGEDDAPASR